MAMQVLTDALISRIPLPASGRIEISDARCIGLALRVTAAGSKSFTFMYRARGGGVNRVTLGTYPALSLSKARATTDKMREAVANGKDPAADRREQRTGGRTFKKLSDRYLVEHAGRHKAESSAAADKRNLRKHILPKLGKRDYLTIRRGDVIALVEGLIAAGTPTLANRVHALVSKVFSFAVDAGLRDDNPCARMARRGVENVGRRVLSDPEIPLFWNGIVEPPEASRTGLGLRLALLTGCRVGEIAAISRAELLNVENPATAAWLIPGERTKNRKAHLVPLAPLARQTVLDLLAALDPDEQFLLPTRSQRRSGPMRPNSLTQAMAYFGERVAAGGHEGACISWTADAPSPHDCRRTLETRLAALGIPKEIRDRCLNHIPGDVGSKHYNVHDYASEKRAALMRWEASLGTILQGGATVIPLVGRA